MLGIALVVSLFISKFSPSPPTSTDKDMQAACNMGYVTLRNMALCIGMLGIDAVSLLLDDFMDPDATWFEKVYGLTDVAEPVAVAVLLVTLRRQVYRFLTTQVTSTTKAAVGKNQVDLYKAQKGFYDKLSSVFFSAATTKLVSPWIVIVKTHVLASKDWCQDYPNNKVIQMIAGCE